MTSGLMTVEVVIQRNSLLSMNPSLFVSKILKIMDELLQEQNLNQKKFWCQASESKSVFLSELLFKRSDQCEYINKDFLIG